MTDSTPIVPFGGLHGSGNDKPQFEIIAALKRDLAAAQERIERLEACVNGEVPEGALKALGRWLAPVLDEDKWATAEKFLNAALLQLLDAQEALKAAEELAESNAKDAERMTFLHERCSVTFTFKRDDGTCAMIAGPTNLRAAIDAAMKEPK